MMWSWVVSSLRLSARRFTDRAIQVVNVAVQQAADRGHAAVVPEHVLLALALVKPGPGRAALEHLGLDLGRECEALAALLPGGPSGEPGNRPPVSPEVEALLDEAAAQSRRLGHNWVGTEHLTVALFSADAGQAGTFLRGRGISPETLRQAVLAVLTG
jgi:ATP-dependent Clp protease ATP-binding subunit ClpC